MVLGQGCVVYLEVVGWSISITQNLTTGVFVLSKNLLDKTKTPVNTFQLFFFSKQQAKQRDTWILQSALLAVD